MMKIKCTCTDDCGLGFNPACTCTCGECNCTDIANIIGTRKTEIFDALCEYLDKQYIMDKVWKRQRIKTKKWKYEYKFSKGGKTLCGFYIAEDALGFMIIFGKKERDLIEQHRQEYTPELLKQYDAAETYHDGKWMMLELDDTSLLEDIRRLLLTKRKPQRLTAIEPDRR